MSFRAIAKNLLLFKKQILRVAQDDKQKTVILSEAKNLLLSQITLVMSYPSGDDDAADDYSPFF